MTMRWLLWIGGAVAATSVLVSWTGSALRDSEYFEHSATCAICHSSGERSTAMRTPTGDDVSPFGTWQATMMANSFRDPYWRAQVAKEVALHPDRAEEIEALCLTCHAPMAHHEARLEDYGVQSIESCEPDPLAHDGVSCTVCHQARPADFGTPDSFNGNLVIEPGREIFGPYENPETPRMLGTSDFVPRFGPHVQRAALCGSCHTLITAHGEDRTPFHEQTPYLEWRNSEFSDEDGRTPASRTCQECHMLDVGSTRIAREENGADMPFLREREHVRAHGFVGGNAFMLDLMNRHREELELEAPAAAFERTAHMTRVQLATRTAEIEIEDARVEDGRLEFRVAIENLTGHKLPTAYPARRVWLRVDVMRGRRLIFSSGRTDAHGRLVGVEDELAIPHYDRIDEPGEVAVFEAVARDASGRPTTSLVSMAGRAKDNRLLPRGWRSDGPHVDVTGPVGVDGDETFGAGGDTVAYSIPLGERGSSTLFVHAVLQYQSVPPAWVEAMRTLDTPETERFVRMYDSVLNVPEVVDSDTAVVRMR